MLTFDARLPDGLAIGLPIMLDEELPPETRTIAAIGVVGAEYWLGHTRDAVAHADALAAVTTTPAARQALPYGAASIDLISICALIEQGDLGQAEERSQRMRRDAAARLRGSRLAERDAGDVDGDRDWARAGEPSGLRT